MWAALHCPGAGDVLVSAQREYEFVDWGGSDHVGGGSHGSLRRGDSLAALAFLNCGPDVADSADAWTAVVHHRRGTGRAGSLRGRWLSGAPVRRRVVVRGRVQGVFFRDSVRRQAWTQASEAGWRTAPMGRSKRSSRGAADAVERMVEFCRHGPPQAEVLDIECFDEAPEGISGFSLR